jgi:hypothetical protein
VSLASGNPMADSSVAAPAGMAMSGPDVLLATKRLAGLSLRGHADAAGFAAAFGGSHRFVLDYLADEVLAGQPGQKHVTHVLGKLGLIP